MNEFECLLLRPECLSNKHYLIKTKTQCLCFVESVLTDSEHSKLH